MLLGRRRLYATGTLCRGGAAKRQDKGELLAVDGDFFGLLVCAPVVRDGTFESVGLGVLVVVALQKVQFPVTLRFGFHSAEGNFADGCTLGDGLGEVPRDGDFACGLLLFRRAVLRIVHRGTALRLLRRRTCNFCTGGIGFCDAGRTCLHVAVRRRLLHVSRGCSGHDACRRKLRLYCCRRCRCNYACGRCLNGIGGSRCRRRESRVARLNLDATVIVIGGACGLVGAVHECKN